MTEPAGGASPMEELRKNLGFMLGTLLGLKDQMAQLDARVTEQGLQDRLAQLEAWMTEREHGLQDQLAQLEARVTERGLQDRMAQLEARVTEHTHGLQDQLAQLEARVTERDLQDRLAQLEARVTELSQATPPPTQEPAPSPTVMLPPEPRVPLPDRFAGGRGKFHVFRRTCELYFFLQPRTFAVEATKVAFVVSLLQGEPQEWAHRLLEEEGDSTPSLASLFEAMSALYADPQKTATAESALVALQQGRRPVEDYIADFRRWSKDTLWNQPALHSQFRQGLSATLKDELARVGVPEDLEELVKLTAQIGRRLRDRRTERLSEGQLPLKRWPEAPSPPAQHIPDPGMVLPPPEPMQIGVIRRSLPGEERARRLTCNLCLYCGEPGHYVRNCPNEGCRHSLRSSAHRPSTKDSQPHTSPEGLTRPEVATAPDTCPPPSHLLPLQQDLAPRTCLAQQGAKKKGSRTPRKVTRIRSHKGGTIGHPEAARRGGVMLGSLPNYPSRDTCCISGPTRVGVCMLTPSSSVGYLNSSLTSLMAATSS